MSRVLVTGAGGFIGSHVVEALVAQGHSVTGMVRYNSSSSIGWLSALTPDIVSDVQIVHGDVRDADSVSSAMAGCDSVLHLAALIGIPYSYQSPASYVATNVTGTMNILQAARDFEIRRVVHTSTSEVYGTALFAPITEDHPLQAQSPYSASKIGADQLALSFWRSFETPVVVLRPFNTYGPRQSLRAVIPTIITQLLLGEPTVRLGALHPTRDLTFVTDTASAFVAALAAPGLDGEVIQLGTGFEIAIGELARLIAEIMEVTIDIVSESERHRPEGSEVERLISDPQRARSLLAWAPSSSGKEGLTAGLAQTIEWMRSVQSGDSLRWRSYHV